MIQKRVVSVTALDEASALVYVTEALKNKQYDSLAEVSHEPYKIVKRELKVVYRDPLDTKNSYNGSL